MLCKTTLIGVDIPDSTVEPSGETKPDNASSQFGASSTFTVNGVLALLQPNTSTPNRILGSFFCALPDIAPVQEQALFVASL